MEFRALIAVVALAFSATAFAQSTDPADSPIASLPALNAQQTQTSISGLSSGAFMAAQFHIAYSEDLVGAGVVAGGPWNCAGSNPLIAPLATAVSTCMNPCKYTWFCTDSLFPDSTFLSKLAQDKAEEGIIDDVANIVNDKVYIFSGQSDETVVTQVVDSTEDFYLKLGVDASQIRYNTSVDAGHAFITNNPADTVCDETQPPFINNCDLEQATRLLDHIYGDLQPPVGRLTGELLRFNQREFFESDMTSMDDAAYVYIPKACKEESCRVHVALHGCQQGIGTLGTGYVTGTGYNEVADDNQIIVLYPQVRKSEPLPFNPKGCWDFWGYSSGDMPPYTYYQKDAPQMIAIKKMIDRLTASAVPVSDTGTAQH